ncbi:MAG: c-type cytochrome biogenesis protein CcmI [Burkholderiales bacterium]|nr:c-type cytochrome biogenesis protein CcmI [Burkholderiales bacterium]
MFWFPLAATLCIAVALGFILPPLLRRTPTGAPTDDSANLAIHRDAVRELDADLTRGIISPDRHAEARRELEARVLEDLQPAASVQAAAGRQRALAGGIALVIPVIAVALYLTLGNPAALVPENRLGMTPEQAEDRRKMLDLTAKLAERMRQHPDDPTGWIMLARAYRSLERHADAARALGQAVELKPDDADLRSDYAEALVFANQGQMTPEAIEQSERALAIDAKQGKALALLGTAAFEIADYRRAITYFQRLLALVPPDTDFARAVQQGIGEARAALAAAEHPAVPGPGIGGRVELAAAMAAKAHPDDTVFVFARAAEGSRMPLAIQRRQVKDLPFTFKLDDSMGMGGGPALSATPAIVVVARISKAGGAQAVSGDLEGTSAVVKPGTHGLNLVIDHVVP